MNFIFPDRLAVRITNFELISSRLASYGHTCYVITKDMPALLASGKINLSFSSIISSAAFLNDDFRLVVEAISEREKDADSRYISVGLLCRRHIFGEVEIERRTFFVAGERNKTNRAVSFDLIERYPIFCSGLLSDGVGYNIQGYPRLKLTIGGKIFTRDSNIVAPICDDGNGGICAYHAFREFSHILAIDPSLSVYIPSCSYKK